MSPAAKRILQAAAQHRRSRATLRWFCHHALASEKVAEAALVQLREQGRVARRQGSGAGTVYDITIAEGSAGR